MANPQRETALLEAQASVKKAQEQAQARAAETSAASEACVARKHDLDAREAALAERESKVGG